MSYLDKLAISGVRSFEPGKHQVIEFTKPLTVIVGENGSGKTTIIECLKYVTTGEMPPNTKGGAFGHDPSIAGSNETMAIVKLRFFSATRERWVAERRFKVTKKKTGAGGLTMKTLEGTMSVVSEGQKKARSSISTKNAEMDKAMTEQLGVSKAILENVIFCHQEDSNWPLSEPAALKKKFDDIFQATDWTKALTEYKDIRKNMNQELIRDKERLRAYQTDRDRAVKIRKEIEKATLEIEVKQAEYDMLDEEIAKISKKNKEFYEGATRHSEIINKAQTLNTQMQMFEDNIASIRSSITELPDKDDELKSKVDNHQEQVRKATTEKSRREREERDATDELNALERRHSQAVSHLGRVEGDLQRFEEAKAARQRLIRDLAQRHQIAGFDHDLSSREQEDFVERLNDALRDLQARLDQQRSDANKRSKEYQDMITRAREEIGDYESTKRAAVNQQRQIGTNVARLNRQLEEVSTTVGDLALAEKTLEEEQKLRTDLEKLIKEADYAAQIAERERSLRDLEEKREQLQNEFATVNTHGQQRANLDQKRQQVARNAAVIQSCITKSTAAFRRILRMDPTEENMEREVNATLRTLEEDVAAAEKTHADAMRESNEAETKLGVAKKTLADLERTTSDMRRKIKRGLTDAAALIENEDRRDTVAEQIDVAKQLITLCKSEISENDGIAKLYKTILKQGKKKHKCNACNRDLSTEELSAFERHCQKIIAETPKQVEDFKQQLEVWTGIMNDLQPLEAVEIQLKAITEGQLPEAEQTIEEASARLKLTTSRFENTLAVLNEQKDRLAAVQGLKKEASEVTRLQNDTQARQREIASIEQELAASGSLATPGELSAQIKTVSDQIRQKRDQANALRNEFQKKQATLNAKKESISSLMLDLEKKRAESSKKESIEKQKETLQAEAATLDQQIKETNQKLADAAAPLRKLQDELAQHEDEARSAEAVTMRKREALTTSANQLDTNMKEIKALENQRLREALDAARTEVERRLRVVGDKKAEIAKLHAEMVAAGQLVARADAELRNLQDNIRLRQTERELAKTRQEYEGLNVEQANQAHKKFEAEYRQQRQVEMQKSARQSELGGIVATMKGECERREKQLREDYKDIEAKYKAELVKVNLAQCAADDVEKLRKAIDQAIMNFHSLKMAEINDTIAELWASTYKGSDIDTIAIKADAEGKTGSGGTRTTYNYRVTMIKDDIEMDMRGRCSAGQKVLASIIIRLALAQSFALQCGILALDEPTTNLDRDNIQGLATSLATIIEQRRHQRNFQLIVITHDEHFLDILGEIAHVNKYSKVYRQVNEGHIASRIERKQLSGSG